MEFKPSPPPVPPRQTNRMSRNRSPGHEALGGLLLFAFVALLLGVCWWWFFWRIEPGNGKIAVLIKKTGRNLPTGEIIARSTEYKGIQLAVLPEGRFFRNPYTWSYRILEATDIPAGKFGVLARKFGKDLPGGQIIAPDDEHKGIVRELLGTGKHRINPYAYEVRIFDDIKIAPGHVGVVVSLYGKDILIAAGGSTNTLEKGFLAEEGSKGVRREVLKEGTHRLNPYLFAVSIVNIQSQRFEFSGADAIMFLTLDGFPVTVEGTLEFNLNVDQVALLTHEVGDMDDVRQKLIFPSAHGFFRIEGSKKNATDFIVGESRQAFQNSLEAYLKAVCAPWGISLNSVLIRDIIPPQEIAAIIRDRELAVQEAKRIEQQIVQAKSQAELEKQRALAEQKRLKVEADTEQIRQKISADQAKVETVIAAKTLLDVAKIDLDAARKDAEAMLKMSEAERKVIEAGNRATADVLKMQVAVFRNDDDYVRAKLYEKVAPNIESVLTTDTQGTILGLPLGASATVDSTGQAKPAAGGVQ
jgi:regulator of protease activity HflC (stomatin/prohibitin superfamily)